MKTLIKFLSVIFFSMSFMKVSAKELEFRSPHGGDFKYNTLIKGRVKTVNTESLRGNKILLFFGFTNCKSVCPLTLNTLKSMMNKFSASEKERIKVLFISVDNERDKLEVMSNYVSMFDRSFLFGTDKDSNLKKILQLYGARYYKIKTDSNKILIDHTSDVFLINEQGQWTHSIPFTLSESEFYKIVSGTDAALSKQYQNRSVEVLNSKLINHKSSSECLLNSQSCSSTYQGNEYSIKLNSDKIISQIKNSVYISMKVAKGLVPFAVDFDAKETYMGNIRPEFYKVGSDEYKADFEIPMCELKKMNWTVTIIFKDEKNNYFAEKFKMKSFESE